MNLLPFQQLIILFSSSWLLEHVCCECTADSASEKETLKVLEPLESVHDIITVKDGEGKYTYKIGFCVDLDGEGAGVVQTDPDGKTHRVGKITKTDIKQGNNWIILTYKDGDTYNSHCSSEPRQAHIVISCNQDSVDPINGHVIEENTNKTGDCYYLFEVESRIACSKQPSGLSIGWLLIIIVLVVAATYLVVGFLYQRFVQQAKGREQIPNLEFWTKFGNLAADGCDFMCRCKRTEEARSYKGLGDDQLGMDEDEERDENILPMY